MTTTMKGTTMSSTIRTRLDDNLWIRVTGNAAIGYIGTVEYRNGRIITETKCYGTDTAARRMAIDLAWLYR